MKLIIKDKGKNLLTLTPNQPWSRFDQIAIILIIIAFIIILPTAAYGRFQSLTPEQSNFYNTTSIIFAITFFAAISISFIFNKLFIKRKDIVIELSELKNKIEITYEFMSLTNNTKDEIWVQIGELGYDFHLSPNDFDSFKDALKGHSKFIKKISE